MAKLETGITGERRGPLDRLIAFCLEQKLIVGMFVLIAVFFGVAFAPFDWKLGGFPRHPVPVDAIPDIGENQQIVFTEWMGRSPQDVEDQITYPLTVALLGIPDVKTIRSNSMFGFSSIYVIFDEEAEFYWSRSRVLEKLSSLPDGTLPPGVRPGLGPDATALGQVFWYTLEGRDEEGNPTGGWDLDELRSIQDWNVRYGLMSAEGVSEVASVGGFVREYQVDVDPDAMRAHGVTLQEILRAVKRSNLDVGARTLEINSVEYFVRGLGYIESVADIENTVVKTRDNVPIYVRNIAKVALGPAMRRGALDKEGTEAVGGVVVVRYGANPLEVIDNVKEKVRQISPGLPRKTLSDGRISQVTVVPFYDRTGLIYETLGTLNTALSLEILVTILVVIVTVMHLRSSVLISGLLPLAVLMCFVGMKIFKVDANIVALSGIAIAIGTMVDMGIVICENILKHLQSAGPDEDRLQVVYRATTEVGSAVLTAILTTIVGFLPVFMMEGPEGKLFRPLAYTKTFALLASAAVAIVVIPPFAHMLFGGSKKAKDSNVSVGSFWLRKKNIGTLLLLHAVAILLTHYWMPLGVERGVFRNVIFVGVLMGGLLAFFHYFRKVYIPLLGFFLRHKLAFLAAPMALVIWGGVIWSGLGREFMPSLDEGSFLWMPTTMPHASIGEALDVLQKQDIAIRSIPEIDTVVGKIGRVESSLDPAPVSMIETVITYKSEYAVDDEGERHRQWRDHIGSPDDIWKEIVRAAEIPGTTSAPKLQPIQTRIIMLQTGMRAPMGVKVFGPSLETIENVGIQIEKFLKEIPSVEPAAVLADRVAGKPYIEIDIDRQAAARYGIDIEGVQDVIEVAIGGRQVGMTVEGRERYPIRVRYMRELRDRIESLDRILVAAPDGTQIPLGQLATVGYISGPQSIKSEDTFLVSYVTFDKVSGLAEVDVVEECKAYLQNKIESGELDIPAGVSYRFTGSYENQVRAQKKLSFILPIAFFIIFMILYMQFRSVGTTLIVFSGILVAWAGGFQMIWLYGQPWFLNFSIFGVHMQDLFQIHPINLSVAVWVGFLALFGIASDDGVVIATYLGQRLDRTKPDSIEGIREGVLYAAGRRIRPCLMTTATTVLALIPVLTSVGRGSDVMVPMAIPSFGGMTVAILTVFVVPVLYTTVKEFQTHTGLKTAYVDLILLCSGFVPGILAMAAYCAVKDLKGAKGGE